MTKICDKCGKQCVSYHSIIFDIINNKALSYLYYNGIFEKEITLKIEKFLNSERDQAYSYLCENCFNEVAAKNVSLKKRVRMPIYNKQGVTFIW